MIGEVNNHSNKFYRSMISCVIDTLTNTLKWQNIFANKTVDVEVPVYYANTVGYDFSLKAFSDDIPSSNRATSLNADSIPRCNIYLNNISVIKEEMRNPNIYSNITVEDKANLRRIRTKMRLLPIQVKFSASVLVESELDSLNVIEAMTSELLPYKISYFKYHDIRIDISLTFDDANINITREKSLSANEKTKVEFEFTIKTMYPSFNDKQKTSNKQVVFTNKIESATSKK